MARSPKDDPRYNDVKHNTWNYHAENAANCPPGGSGERNPPPISPSPSVMNDNSMYVNANFGNDVYMNKHVYSPQSSETEDKMFNNMPNAPRNQNFGNAMLNLGNGQVVPVFYDENNKQLIFPMSGQYELFNHNQGLCDMSLPQPPLFTLNQDYSVNNNVHVPPTATVNQNNAYQENHTQPTSNFLKDLLGNLEPNSSGTYSPFGQNYPLNHPDASNLNMHLNPILDQKCQPMKPENSPKRNETSPLADTSNKKRIVAEVKPMRPTYSDVLAKNTKNTTPSDNIRRAKPQNIETKPLNNKANLKPEKLVCNVKQNDENKQKNERKQHTNTISSGSESGDINTDEMEKRPKPNKRSKNKHNNISRKWSSLDDITNEEDISYKHDNDSQFVFIEEQEKPLKKEKKCDANKNKHADKNESEDNFKVEEEEEETSFIFQETQNECTKSKKKKDGRSYHKAPKPVQDKKKGNQFKFRRNKPGYLGLAQNYMEHWGGATWKAIVWFIYLLSDICRMSLHLSFDL
ncbi:hypothetical protein O3G_MSEX012922 [Manduca sexta]|uniref:Uncharacterized protein n=1 Tax=Manduca sexta TaxID=7130 RepID=A0A921ZRZ3_MANSE|nr:hypothetical protein O3G_MSEX012922 [Manduca sexta]